MAIYTVHVPDDAPDMLTRADRTRFVREGASLWAFVFGGIYLLWHRLWEATLAYLIVAGLLAALGVVFHVPPAAVLALAALMHLFVAVEGNDLRRWALERRGLRCVDIVSGSAREDAELAFFHRQPAIARTEARTAAPAVSTRLGLDPTPAVIGMFPDGGR